MSPPINKDWWLAAALTGAALPAAMGQVTATPDRRQTGVLTTVTQGKPTTSTSAPIYIESARGQKLTTGPNQTLHVLFSDQSAMTLGPNSEIVISEYRFNTQAKDGNLLVDMTKGLLRVVGGLISKKSETVVRTSTATIGIRGGIGIIDSTPNKTNATFLFGQSMRLSGSNGDTTNITRGGFGASSDGSGVSTPERTPTSQLSSYMNALERRPTDGNQSNPNPSTAPTGQLPLTGGGANNLGGNLANDRLKNIVDTNVGNNPGNTLKTLLGIGQVQNQS